MTRRKRLNAQGRGEKVKQENSESNMTKRVTLNDEEKQMKWNKKKG